MSLSGIFYVNIFIEAKRVWKLSQNASNHPDPLTRHLRLPVHRAAYIYLWTTFFWTAIVLVYFFAQWGLLSCKWEQILQATLDVLTKGVVCSTVDSVHNDMHSPSVKLAYSLHTQQKAATARRTFLRFIFHEVRVPLNSIVLGTQVIEQVDNLPADAREAIEVMHNSVNMMSVVLNDVLSFQKMEDGMLKLDHRYFNIKAMVDAVVFNFSTPARIRGLQIEALVDPELSDMDIWADESRLASVVSNFLSNSIKFSPKSTTITVCVSLELPKDKDKAAKDKDPSLRSLHVEVRDRGHGISKEDLSQLFNPFVQIRPGDLQEGRGSGLGLCICRNIIVLHGGFIGARSKVGKGSTFFFNIPTNIRLHQDMECKAEETVLEVANFASSPVQQVTTSEQVSRVLVVDDASINRKMVMLVFKRLGFECEQACDGEEAVKAIIDEKKHFNVIMMDNVMPKLSGVEATRKIRQAGFNGVIVGLTGNALEGDMREFHEAGANEVLSKPANVTQITAALKRLNVHIPKETGFKPKKKARKNGNKGKTDDSTPKQGSKGDPCPAGHGAEPVLAFNGESSQPDLESSQHDLGNSINNLATPIRLIRGLGVEYTSTSNPTSPLSSPDQRNRTVADKEH
eukprot:g136.t1